MVVISGGPAPGHKGFGLLVVLIGSEGFKSLWKAVRLGQLSPPGVGDHEGDAAGSHSGYQRA